MGLAPARSREAIVGVVPESAVAATGGTSGSATPVPVAVGVVAAPVAVGVVAAPVAVGVGAVPVAGGVAVPGGIEVTPSGSPLPLSNHHSNAPNSGIPNNNSSHQGNPRSVEAAATSLSGTRAVSVSVGEGSAMVSGVGAAVEAPGGTTKPVPSVSASSVGVAAVSAEVDSSTSGGVAAAITSWPGSEVANPKKARVAGVAVSL